MCFKCSLLQRVNFDVWSNASRSYNELDFAITFFFFSTLPCSHYFNVKSITQYFFLQTFKYLSTALLYVLHNESIESYDLGSYWDNGPALSMAILISGASSPTHLLIQEFF